MIASMVAIGHSSSYKLLMMDVRQAGQAHPQLALEARGQQTAPGTTCGNHRANSPRHLRASPGMVFAVQMHEPGRRAGRIPCRIPPYKRGVRRFKSYCAHFFEYLSMCLGGKSRSRTSRRYLACVRQELCGTWMPRAKTTCARTPGHGGGCMTATNMANRREYNRLHGHRESAESRKKSNRKYRISSYGLTQEQFDRLLDAQQHTCGMCHEPFEEGAAHPRGP